MKKCILLSLVLIVSSNFLLAQEIKVEEPGFEGEIIYADEAGNTKDLEYQTASVKTKASTGAILTGIGKVKMRVSVRGKVSTTLLPQREVYYFVYNHGENTKNPKNFVQLVQFKKKGKNRVAEIASVSVTSGAQSSGDVDFISFKGVKYLDSEVSYLIKVSNLEPGHYGFFVGEEENNNAHLFSIEGYED